MLMLKEDDYMFLFDLKSRYHHVDIFESHRKYFGLQWEVHGSIHFYVFRVLHI